MKKISLLTGALGLLIASSAAFSAPKGQDVYMLSNQKMLEDTVSELDLKGLLKGSIPKSSVIAIRNMETEGTTDKKIVALVEDQLITQLVGAGYKVVERDDNAIRRALEERSAGRNFSLIRTDLSPQNAARDVSISNSPAKKSISVNNIKIEDNTSHMVKTHLTGADFIINYRVQELGINYTEALIDGDKGASDRAAIARIHVRVESAVTGKIVKSENITAYKADVVSRDMLMTLAKYKFSQFHNGYPTNDAVEDRIFRYDDRHLFIEYGFISTQSSNSKLAFGVKSGPNRIALERTSITVEEKINGTKQDLDNDFKLVVFGRDVGTINSSTYGEIDVIAEFGLGEGDMNVKDGSAVESSNDVAIKLGVGLDADIVWGFSGKAGIDLYAGEAGVVENGYISVLYTFN